MEYYSVFKKGNPIPWHNMDETRGYYVKWNKPGTKRQLSYDLTYVESKNVELTDNS